MNRLQAHAERLARTETRRQIERIAASWSERVRGVAVDVESSAVVLRGRNILRRWLTEPGLRFLRSMPR